jgi:hypothetical protein
MRTYRTGDFVASNMVHEYSGNKRNIERVHHSRHGNATLDIRLFYYFLTCTPAKGYDIYNHIDSI